MFITSYCFTADIPKVSLLQFLAQAPPELFCFIVLPNEPSIYGYFLSDELMEYFTNEFAVNSLRIIPEEEIMQAQKATARKIWGNPELLNL